MLGVPSPKTKLIEVTELSDREIEVAISTLTPIQVRSLQQIIRSSKDSASKDASVQTYLGNHLAAGGFNGAWEALDSLSQEIERLRKSGSQPES